MWIVIRLVGILCIMAASLLAGAGIEGRMRKRWQLLQEMQETLAFLEKEMIYHRSPVQEAFQSAAPRCATELGQVLLWAAEQIEKREGRPFPEIWGEALARCIPGTLLQEEEFCVLKETAAALCNTDTVMQRTLMEKYADRFLAMSRKEAEICREKGGLYRRLAAAAGVFLVILLI